MVEIIKEYYPQNDPSGACEKIVKEASKAWKNNDNFVVDDITCVVIFFN